MDNKIINIAGKGFVTSSRAAQLSQYSQDYIGQLCRNDNIECKRVSGEWQVNLRSLLAYKHRFNPDNLGNIDLTITKDDKCVYTDNDNRHQDNILVGGVEYISSRDAAKKTGYSQDYIGQLARAGVIEAKKVGRKWFVVEEDLKKHKKHNDNLLAALQTNSVGARNSSTSSFDNSKTNFVKITKLAQDGRVDRAIPSIAYKRDDGFLMPGISSYNVDVSANTTIKSMPIERVDVRRTSVDKLKKGPSSTYRDLNSTEDSANQVGGPIRSISYIGRLSITFSIVFLFIVIILPIYRPEEVHGYLNHRVENLVTLKKLNVLINKHLISVFNSTTIYSK